MAIYRVLFSGLAGGLVAYAAIATVAGAASLLSPAAIGGTMPLVAQAMPAETHRSLADEGQIAALADRDDRDQMRKLVVGMLA